DHAAGPGTHAESGPAHEHVRDDAARLGPIDPSLADYVDESGRPTSRAPDRPPDRQRRRPDRRASGWDADALDVLGDHGRLVSLGRGGAVSRWQDMDARRRVSGETDPRIVNQLRHRDLPQR